MKRCCHCNAKWDNQNDYPLQSNELANASRVVLGAYARDHSKCSVMYFWYDADYENMMFDLRRMNQC